MSSPTGLPPDPLQQTLATVLAQLDEILRAVRREYRDFLTVEDVAAALGRSAYTIRRWIADGRVRATRIAGTGPRGRLLVPYDELRRLKQGGGLAEPRPGRPAGADVREGR